MRVPHHVAIIMDGNGRWAEARGRDRTLGHLKGAKTARKIIDECARLRVEHLTLYAFSSENWFRPAEEISFLMHLLKRHLVRERRVLMENNIRFTCIGEIERLPQAVQKEVTLTVQATAGNTGMKLTFALSYGSRQEIANAARAIAFKVAQGLLKPEEINPDVFNSYLESSFLPDPDLIIRTSGESRLSNFLMWQAAYSEIHITETFWPDFSVKDLKRAFDDFARRERRYGRTGAQLPTSALNSELRSPLEASP